MRQPKPWFRASKSAWFVEHQCRQVRLGKHPDGYPPPKKVRGSWNPPQPILDAFYKLMASDQAVLPGPARLLAAQVCDLFLSHSERHNEPATFAWYRHFLQSFAELFGRVPARDLKPFHVTRWLDAQRPVQRIRHTHTGTQLHAAADQPAEAQNWQRGAAEAQQLRRHADLPLRLRLRLFGKQHERVLLRHGQPSGSCRAARARRS